MKSVNLVLLLLLSVSGFSQSVKILTEINDQVWTPFVKSFNQRDDSIYKNIHSKELFRVNRDDKSIVGLEQYLPKISEAEKKNWANWQPYIELRFIERIVSEDKAFESGYFRSIFKNTQSNEIRTNIAKFIVLLHKEEGVWKILMDVDGKEDATEQLFKNAASMDDIHLFSNKKQKN